MLKAGITINAPPSIVLEPLLDFPKPRTWSWHDGIVFSEISITTPASKTAGSELEKGDKVKLVSPGMTFSGTILSNEPGLFSWTVFPLYIFKAHHSFRIDSDPSDVNRTIFSQSETFTGLLGLVGALSWAKILGGWDKINGELKVAAEAKWARERDSC